MSIEIIFYDYDDASGRNVISDWMSTGGFMTTNKQWTFMKSMANPEYRRAFADEMVGTGLAFQIRRMREAKGWTQEDVAQLTKKAQETISQWENPNYGRYSLSTLKQLGGAFDVALLVRFVSFGELADWTMDVTRHRLTPASYEEERQGLLQAVNDPPSLAPCA